jgi:Flp pilus assembly protein TadB
VRPAAASAVVSILRLLPGRDLDTDIGRVLGHVANCLRSKAQGVRDSARKALAAAATGLGRGDYSEQALDRTLIFPFLILLLVIFLLLLHLRLLLLLILLLFLLLLIRLLFLPVLGTSF